MITSPFTVYALNLVHRTERKESIESQFQGRDEFDLHVIPAIELRQPTWGLWQTFYKIVGQEKKKGSPFFIFCEDDHVFTSQYNKRYLFDCIEEADTMGADLLSGGMSVVSSPVQVRKNLFWVDLFNGMQFTVVYSRLYEQILAAKTDGGYTLDIQLSYLAKTKFVMYPYISVQKEFGYSDATTTNNEEGKIDRFFRISQESLEKLCKVRNFFQGLSEESICDVLSTDVSQCYIPTFVINLKERTGRLEHILSQFEGKAEFDVQVFNACKGRTGAEGLWNSIVEIIRMAKDADEDFVLICEDDHVFTSDYNRDMFLHQIMLAGMMGAQLLNGGIGGMANLVPVGCGLYWVDKFWCTQFIVVYKSAYDVILNAYFGIRDVADEKLSSILTNKLLIAPFISEQKDFGYSDATESNNGSNPISKFFDTSRIKMGTYFHAEKYMHQTDHYPVESKSAFQYMEECGAQKLQLGCGGNLLDGWLNTDLAPVVDAYFLDAAQPFPFRDDAMDFVFAEHLIEELALDVIFKMFKEVHRVLKIGGVIRLAFYSPENLIQMRNGKTNADFCNAYKKWCLHCNPKLKDVIEVAHPEQLGSMALSSFIQKLGKRDSYDSVIIKCLLENAGFSRTKTCPIHESEHPLLRNVERHKVYIPEAIYQFETIAIEAVKA